MRVLDELADAFHAVRGGRRPRAVVSSARLEDQFGSLISPTQWTALQRQLGCTLPSLEFNQGHWWLPAGLATVWDLAASVGRSWPDSVPPPAASPAAWREAQIFAGVRDVLVNASNCDPTEVTRPARLPADLGLV
jgi:hypothetical protein